MPVNIFDIPSEERVKGKKLSLWIEVGILVCIITIYICVFLIYFPQYLSKNSFAFWIELLLIPLLFSGTVFFFRIILLNNEDIEAVNWNKTRYAYYQELLKKGRVNLNIIELQVRLPDLNGDVVNIAGNSLLPVRYTPKYTHMSRYLAFNSLMDKLNDGSQIQERNFLLFNKIMGDLINDIHMHITLLPKYAKVKVICFLNDNLKPLIEDVWRLHFANVFPIENVEFSENLSESIDNLLDKTDDEYIVLIAANFHGAELLAEEIDNRSESVIFLLGKLKKDGETSGRLSLGSLYRPEYDWVGIDKSLIWGHIRDGEKLSGIVYSGLNEEEIKKLVLKTTDFMSENALSPYIYVDSGNYMCLCPPLAEFLQLSYVNKHLHPGRYLLVNKNNNLLVSHFFNSVTGD
ncbi:hypothetical protein R2217_000630 [Cronobacter turicensis]|nr:hypothetical protein [Cronobacter turicensis]ELQ6252751.1 hypothetical protein [Cronobacter turicensis]ELQ6257095.1 hypothetical protein [Cronobacter turicensis]